MANALILEGMSPALLKVVDRAKREPEGRFHSLAHLIGGRRAIGAKRPKRTEVFDFIEETGFIPYKPLILNTI